LQIVLDNPT
jgi:hypothetical protein